MRNCILGGDNFRAFRVDLGGQNSKGDNFQLYPHKAEGIKIMDTAKKDIEKLKDNQDKHNKPQLTWLAKNY